jgi:long-chain acyl-CoA synthetase
VIARCSIEFRLGFDISVGRAGYPLVSCEIRLRNWEEGQYRNTDEPHPRGEVLIGGKVVASGYFAEASKEDVNFVEIDGTRYFCTGDIGEMFPDGTLKIIGASSCLLSVSIARTNERTTSSLGLVSRS